jgi:hypothetical protein
MRIGLVGCVKTKVDHAARAADLYASSLFMGRRRYVEASCDMWFVLSARHGLVSPDTVLEPYDDTLIGQSVATKRSWAASVVRALDEAGIDYPSTTFEIHAGADYRNFGLVTELRARGSEVEVIAEHLGIGEQLGLYARSSPAAQVSRRRTARGSYAAFTPYLLAFDGDACRLRFPELERILGRQLPASARRHRAWWGNDTRGTHSHAGAWMDAGWQVDRADLDAGVVQFVRTRP